jgi:hypothetical protein
MSGFCNEWVYVCVDIVMCGYVGFECVGVCMCWFCKVWVCVCLDFVMSGCMYVWIM